MLMAAIMELRGALLILAACTVYGLVPGPKQFSKPTSTFIWPRLDEALGYGSQPSVPALDSSGNTYLSSSAYAGPACANAQFSSFSFNAQLNAAKLNWKVEVPIPGFCVATGGMSPSVSDAFVSESHPGGAVMATCYANENVSGTPVSAVVAITLTGAPLWTAVLPPTLSRAGLVGPSSAVLVSNGTQLAVLCAGVGSNASVVLIDVLSGHTDATFLIPNQAMACNGSLASVKNLVAAKGSDGGDVLFIDGTSQPFVPCSMAWAVTGPRAGVVIWGAGFGGTFSPVESPDSLSPRVVSVFQSGMVGAGAAVSVMGISVDTGAALWTFSLPGKENFIAGSAAAGPYVFVMASFSVWRGCAAPLSTLYALNASTGVVLNAMPNTHFPDIGPSGALLAVSDPTSPGGQNSLLYWRETNGWGSYDAYITAASFGGGYFLITTRYHGSEYATNVAHDSQGSNPVPGCPPTVDSPPGRTGAMITGPLAGQLLVTDWAGFQLFTDQQ